MKTSTPSLCTIEQIKKRAKLPLDFNNDFIISSNVKKDLVYFNYPCRLDAFAYIICTKGSVRVAVNLKEFEVGQGTMFANTPSNIIQIKEHSPDFESFAIIISREFLAKLNVDVKSVLSSYLHMKQNPCTKLSKESISRLKGYFNVLDSTTKRENALFKQDIIQALILSAMYEICEIVHSSLDAEMANKQPSKNRHDILFTNFMELVYKNHKQEHQVGFYADLLCITPKYLSTLIKHISGRSASEWIDEFIILEAKNLLKFSEMTIKEIAFYLNFSTQSFFGKYFKQHTGISPNKYRSL